MTKDEIDRLVAEFLGCIKEELASPRRSFLRYCLHYRVEPSWWGPNSDQQPYFFAMLWLTCLVAYGFPIDVSGDFHTRMRAALDGAVNLHSNKLGELDDVWEDLEKWTENKSNDYRSLDLPPRSAHRTIIGRSHYLAFPNRFDSEKLAAVLRISDLAGREPPVRLVLEALLAERARFSLEFQNDLDLLFSDYLDQGRDPKDSPFWRAVRQAARDLPVEEDVRCQVVGRAGLLAEWDDDELLTPFVAFSPDWVVPGSWGAEELELPVGKLSRRAVLDAAQLAELFASPGSVLRGVEKRAVEEGVVPLVEEVSGLYRVATAEEVASCEMALVREKLSDAIRGQFGGRGEESGVPGWVLITRARFEQRDDLGPELSSVRTLLQTTEAPRPALVGGIRVSGNTFYALDQYLPLVRARHAARVTIKTANQGELACARVTSDDDYWRLPALGFGRGGGPAETFHITASYEVDLAGRRLTREARTEFSLQSPIFATDYKGLPSGSFRLETCAHDGAVVTGPLASLPLGFTRLASDRALDVLPFDASARWLGPGLGEMSLEGRSGFPWLVVGPKNHPEYLVLDCDPGEAPLPSDGFSQSVGDRRHWTKALSKDVATWWHQAGAYLPDHQWPAPAKNLLSKYRARINDKRRNIASVQETHLDSHLREARWGLAGSSNGSIHDVLAALFQNRAGLPLREVHEHIGRVLDLEEAPQLREQLVRALVEAGAVDSLRRSDGRQTIIVARKPRLLAYRRGPRWLAALVGLTPSLIRNEFRTAAARLDGAAIDEQRTSNEHLPAMLRVGLADEHQLVELSRELGLVEPEYVEWADGKSVPDIFRIAGSLRIDPVPDMYLLDAIWCWDTGSFRRRSEISSDVNVERRRDGHRVPIYVVTRADSVLGWSYYRTWSLLHAYELRGRPFLKEEEPGVFAIVGDSPLHLPLPLARLCAIIGLGAPGPRVLRADSSKVEAYCYPFGVHLSRLLVPFLPTGWLLPRTQ